MHRVKYRNFSMHTKGRNYKTMKNTKANVKYNNVNEYYDSLSKPARAAFLVGIRFALKVMRESKNSKENYNSMMSLLAK